MEIKGIKAELAAFKKKFDSRLFDYLAAKKTEAEELAPAFQETVVELERLARAGGKRLRPWLVFLGFKSNKNQPSQPLWQACLAVSLIQSFALIHDDLIDKSVLRRGVPTCWQELGLDKAVLVGDLGLILADSLIPLKAKPYFDLMKWEMVAGQWLDVDQAEADLDVDQVLKIMELKTAAYTFKRPLQIGAVLAGAGQEVLQAFSSYGQKMGLAFQIKDDILGIFGSQKKTGKPVGDDIREGKKTLLAVKLFEPETAAKINQVDGQWKKLNKIYGHKNVKLKEIQWLRRLMIKYGVLVYAEQKANQLAEEAEKVIKDLDINHQEKEILLNLGEFVVKRSY